MRAGDVFLRIKNFFYVKYSPITRYQFIKCKEMLYVNKLGLSWAKLSHSWGWDLDKLEYLQFKHKLW